MTTVGTPRSARRAVLSATAAAAALAFLLATAVAPAAAAVASGTRLWVRRYPYPIPKDQMFLDAAVDKSGNVYVCGTTDRGTAPNIDYDALVVKYSPSGARLWSRVYSGTAPNGWDIATAIALDGAGNPHVAIDSAAATAGNQSDIVVAKWTAAGVFQWAPRFNGGADEDDIPGDLAVDGGGNVVVTGYSDADAGNDTNNSLVTLKYDPSGVLMWGETYDGPANLDDRGLSVVVDTAHRVYVAGSSERAADNEDWIVRKLSDAGALIWAKRYNGSGNGKDVPRSIKLDRDANVYVAGYGRIAGAGRGPSDYVLMKFAPSGAFRWIRYYDGPTTNDHDRVGGMIITRNVILVTGVSPGPGSGGNYDAVTLRYLPSGARTWARRYDGPAHRADFGNAVAGGTDGSVYVAGTSLTVPSRSDDFLLLKYRTSGSLAWVRRYDNGSIEGDMALAVCANAASVYVAGVSYVGSPPNHQQDGAVLRYKP